VTAALALLAFALAAALFVAVPLLRPSREVEAPPLPQEVRRFELAERRDAAYAALRELELELRTGKLIESDYEHARAELRADAIAALRELERLDAPAQAPAPVG